MPLSPPAPRVPVHNRTVECAAFMREDGLWEVEASLFDRKPYPHADFERRVRAPGEPVHKMSIRLTVNAEFEIVDAEATMDDAPYVTCWDVPPRVSALAGVKLGAGWREAVRQRLPKRQACTHLVELLGPAVTTLYQASSYPHDLPSADAREKPGASHPFFLDGCHSWRADGPNAARLFPQFARAPAPDETT